MVLCMVATYNRRRAMIFMSSSIPAMGVEPSIEHNDACMAHHEGGV